MLLFTLKMRFDSSHKAACEHGIEFCISAASYYDRVDIKEQDSI